MCPIVTPKKQSMIRPAELFGPVLAGRGVASHLRDRIEDALAQEQLVVVDLEGVEAMSPSFADELFAKLPPGAVEQGRVRFEHLTPALEPLARYVIAHRSGKGLGSNGLPGSSRTRGVK
jgi:hypothetical protein